MARAVKAKTNDSEEKKGLGNPPEGVRTPDGVRSSSYGQLAAALAATGAVPIGVANGSLILQYDPNIPLNDSSVYLNMDLINNDQGAIYDSATLTLLSPLAQALYALPANQLAYATIQDMIADWGVGIQPPPSGNIYQGWNRTVNPDGSVDLNNIGGIPDFTYTTWRDSINFPGQSTMALTVQIPLTQLEGGYEIALGTTPVNNAFTPVDRTGAFPPVADGVSYDVIPEATTIALMIVGLAGAYIGRKITHAKEAASNYMHRTQD